MATPIDPIPTTRKTVLVEYHPQNVIEAAERILGYYRHPNQTPEDYKGEPFRQDSAVVMAYYDQTLSQLEPRTVGMSFYQMTHYLVASNLMAVAFDRG